MDLLDSLFNSRDNFFLADRLTGIHLTKTRVNRHTSCMNQQDLLPSISIGDIDADFPIKSTWSSQRRINHIRDVRRPNHNDLPPAFQTIHQGQQLRDNTPFHLTMHFTTFRCDCINFIKENNRRRILLRFLKNLTKILFTLAIEFTHNLRAINGVKIRT